MAGFRVHGAEVEVKEGDWPGIVVAVEFPDLERARACGSGPPADRRGRATSSRPSGQFVRRAASRLS
ncbi:DUF1330 domain-containing protein [Micromonospora sp. NPDC023633]|uniref:DUF1330 domain-containing protein n=1 Tax=Micromonospora sp. NPDC023633 TaxID=3154320 RepID=UPI0033F3E8C2